MAVTDGREGTWAGKRNVWVAGGWASTCMQVRIYEVEHQQVASAPARGTGTQGLSGSHLCPFSHTFEFVHGVQVCGRVHVHVCKSMWRSENTLTSSFAHRGQGLADVELTT